MKTSFLNSGLLLDAARAAGAEGTTPDVAVRLERALNGASGEGYLLLFGKTLVTAERPSGKGSFEFLCAPAEKCAILRQTRESFRTDSSLLVGVDTVNCSWSNMEQADADAMLAVLQEFAAPPVAPAVLFVAGLMYVAGADEELPKEEEAMVRRLSPPEALTDGVAFYREHPVEVFALAAARLSAEQKKSLLANQLEVAMADGVFRSAEQRMLHSISALLGVSDEEYRQIESVLLLKNSHSSLFASGQDGAR